MDDEPSLTRVVAGYLEVEVEVLRGGGTSRTANSAGNGIGLTTAKAIITA